VFTALIEALGVKDVQVDEIWDLEGESLVLLQFALVANALTQTIIEGVWRGVSIQVYFAERGE
jgi:hypothetical protein